MLFTLRAKGGRERHINSSLHNTKFQVNRLNEISTIENRDFVWKVFPKIGNLFEEITSIHVRYYW